MNVARIDAWRLPGCSDGCAAWGHDPHAHEEYGRNLEWGAAAPPVVRTGALTVDLRATRAFVGDREIRLSPTEWSALSFLARNVGRVVSQDAIIDHIWGRAYREIERNASANLRMVVGYRLRARLGAAAHLIAVAPGIGYRLDECDEHDAPARRWARDWDACQLCRSTTRPHHTRGLCSRCSARQRRAGAFV